MCSYIATLDDVIHCHVMMIMTIQVVLFCNDVLQHACSNMYMYFACSLLVATHNPSTGLDVDSVHCYNYCTVVKCPLYIPIYKMSTRCIYKLTGVGWAKCGCLPIDDWLLFLALAMNSIT